MSGCCVSPSFILMFAETFSLSPSFPVAPAAARGVLSEPRSLPVTPLCSAPSSPFSHPGWNLSTYFSYHSLPCPLSPGSTDLLAVGAVCQARASQGVRCTFSLELCSHGNHELSCFKNEPFSLLPYFFPLGFCSNELSGRGLPLPSCLKQLPAL